jgi:hypothetical protein
MPDQKLARRMKIDVAKLTYLSTCVDQIVDWGLDTLSSTSLQLRCWLFSIEPHKPSTKPFKRPQELATVKRYKDHFKQLLYYTFRTASLDASTCDRLYGIQFTPEQRQLIQEIRQMLNEGQDEVRQYIDNCQVSRPSQPWDWNEDEDDDENDDYGDEGDEDEEDEDEEEEEEEDDDDDDDGREMDDEIAVESVSTPDKCDLMVGTSVESNEFSCSSFRKDFSTPRQLSYTTIFYRRSAILSLDAFQCCSGY